MSASLVGSEMCIRDSKRAVLGNSDGTPPWGNPEPMGRQFQWAKVEDELRPIEWEIASGPGGAAPPMGFSAFGALPDDLASLGAVSYTHLTLPTICSV
eukprot:10383494-Alexandrium_andersonii.AAC.1